MNILDFARKKQEQQKITMVTCYDYTSARLLAETAVDCILVGDSAAMTMHGFATTLPASVEMMAAHTAAVARGAPKKMIIGDLPFLSYRQGLHDNINAVRQLMQAGAQAIKLEGATGNIELIRHLVESGVPMLGHLGLTPQSVHALGGYKVQGKTEAAEQKLREDAQALEEAGCVAVVLECIPHALAAEITTALSIPTIGIGAGNQTDGQVLVWQDMLGLNLDFQPKFVKRFVEAGALIQQGIHDYIRAVNTGDFPSHAHHY